MEQIIELINSVQPIWVYALIFGIAYLENILPPIPGDLVVVFGGYLVGMGKLSFLPTVFWAGLGGAIGFMTLFEIGKHIGRQASEKKGLKWISQEQLEKSQGWMQKYGQGIVLANRFLAGTRSVISLSAGISHLNTFYTLISSTISSFVWCALLVYLGFWLGDRWELVGEWLATYSKVIFGVLAVVAAIWAYRKFGKSNPKTQDS